MQPPPLSWLVSKHTSAGCHPRCVQCVGKVITPLINGATWQTLHDFGHPSSGSAVDPNIQTGVRRCLWIMDRTWEYWVSSNVNLGASSHLDATSAPGKNRRHPHCITILNDGTLVCTYSGRRNVSGTFTQSSRCVYLQCPVCWRGVIIRQCMFYWTKDIVIDPNMCCKIPVRGRVQRMGGAPNGTGADCIKQRTRGTTWTRIFALDRVTSCTFNPADPNNFLWRQNTKGVVSSDIKPLTRLFNGKQLSVQAAGTCFL